MAQQSPRHSTNEEPQNRRNVFPDTFKNCRNSFDRDRGFSVQHVRPPPMLSPPSLMYPEWDLPVTTVSTCMYLAPLPIQSCYVTPSASVEALLVSLRERNPHFCCVLQLTTGLVQQRTLPFAPPAVASGGAQGIQRAVATSPCPLEGPRFAGTAAGSSAGPDSVWIAQTPQSCLHSYEGSHAPSRRTVYVGWIGECLSRADEAAFSKAMKAHTCRLGDGKEVCLGFVPPFGRNAAADFSVSQSTATTAVEGSITRSSFQFLGLSAGLCECYKLKPWEPVQVSFVHLDAIFAGAPCSPQPAGVCRNENSSLFSSSASQASCSAARCSGSTYNVAPVLPAGLQQNAQPQQEPLADAPRAPANCRTSGTPHAQSRATAAADNRGDGYIEHLATPGRDGEDAAELSRSIHVKTRGYRQIPWDVVPTSVEVTPVAEEDWEVVELQSSRIEEELLMQIAVVMPSIPFPLWASKSYTRPARLVAIVRPCLYRNGISSSTLEVSENEDIQIEAEHDPLLQWSRAAICSEGKSFTAGSASAHGRKLNPHTRTPAAYSDDASSRLSVSAVAGECRALTEGGSDATRASVALAYPPFVLLKRDTELHVRPFVRKPSGPKALPFQCKRPSSNSSEACNLALPSKRKDAESAPAAKPLDGALTASRNSTEGRRMESNLHSEEPNSSKSLETSDKGNMSIADNRNVTTNHRPSSSSAKHHHSNGDAKGDQIMSSVRAARSAGPAHEAAQHAVRLDWDSRSSASAVTEDRVPGIDTPTDTIPSFRMRVVAAYSRHLRRPTWVPTLRTFRPSESATKGARAGTNVNRRQGALKKQEDVTTENEEGATGDAPAPNAAKKKSQQCGGTQPRGDTDADVHAQAVCAPIKGSSTGTEQDTGSGEPEGVEELDEEEQSLDLRRCYACWLHPCHVVALQRKQPWVQGSIHQAAAEQRLCPKQQQFSGDSINSTSRSRHDLFPTTFARSCALRSSPPASTAPSGAAASATSTAAYVWISKVVPSECRILSKGNAPGRPAATAATALTVETEAAAEERIEGHAAAADSPTGLSTASVANIHMSTFSHSWRHAALSGLVLLTAFPDGRIPPGSVALPLHMRRVYSLPLCSFVFVTPCVRVPTLPKALFVLPLCPASLSLEGAADKVGRGLGSTLMTVSKAVADSIVTSVTTSAVVTGAAHLSAPYIDPSPDSRCDGVLTAGGLHLKAQNYRPDRVAAQASEEDSAVAHATPAADQLASTHVSALRGIKVSAVPTTAQTASGPVACISAATPHLNTVRSIPRITVKTSEVSDAHCPAPQNVAHRRKKERPPPNHEKDGELPAGEAEKKHLQRKLGSGNLLDYLRTYEGKKHLQASIYQHLMWVSKKNANVSCPCVTGLAVASSTATALGAVAVAASPSHQTTDGDSTDDCRYIYYGCPAGEDTRENGLVPFALWEGAVLQVPLVLPSSIVTPTATADAGAAHPRILPSGEIHRRRAGIRRKSAGLATTATTAADASSAMRGGRTHGGVAAATADSIGAKQPVSVFRRCIGARGMKCALPTRTESRSASWNQPPQQHQHSGDSSPTRHSCNTHTPGVTAGVPALHSPHERYLAAPGSRLSIPAADAEGGSSVNEGRRDSFRGFPKRLEGDAETILLEEDLTYMLREGLQDLYVSSSADSDTVVEKEDKYYLSGMSGSEDKQCQHQIELVAQATAAPRERQFSHGGRESPTSRSLSSSNDVSCHKEEERDCNNIMKQSESFRTHKSMRRDKLKMDRGACRDVISPHSNHSYGTAVRCNSRRVLEINSQERGACDTASGHRSTRQEDRASTHSLNGAAVPTETVFSEEDIREQTSDGRRSGPLLDAHAGLKDGISAHEGSPSLEGSSNYDYTRSLRAAQAAWAREALLFEETMTSELEEEDEESIDEEVQTEDEEMSDDTRPHVAIEKRIVIEQHDTHAQIQEEGGRYGETTTEALLPSVNGQEANDSQSSAHLFCHRSVIAARQTKEYHARVKETPEDLGGGGKKDSGDFPVTVVSEGPVVSPANNGAAPPNNASGTPPNVSTENTNYAHGFNPLPRVLTSMCTGHDTSLRDTHRGCRAAYSGTMRHRSAKFSPSTPITFEAGAAHCNSLRHVVMMLDVIVAFRTACLPTGVAGGVDEATSTSAVAGDYKGTHGQGKADTQHLRGKYLLGRDNRSQKEEASEVKISITLPQLPADVLPMALSLATQKHPLGSLLHGHAGRRARGSDVLGSAFHNPTAHNGDPGTKDVGRATRRKELEYGQTACSSGEYTLPQFVLCDASFLQKCQQGKIPLQILDPVVLLHASSSAEVATLKATAERTAASLEMMETPSRNAQEQTVSASKFERERKALLDGNKDTATAPAERDIVTTQTGETVNKFSNRHMVGFNNVAHVAQKASKTAAADCLCKGGDAEPYHLSHSSGNTVIPEEPGVTSAHGRRATIYEQNNLKVRYKSSNRRSNTSLTHITGKRSWCFPPCLVLDAEQQSLSYTQWWLCEAVLRSHRAVAAAAAAHEQDGPDRLAAELLHLTQLQCVEQLNPDLLDASAGERQCYVDYSPSPHGEAADRNFSYQPNTRICQPHKIVEPQDAACASVATDASSADSGGITGGDAMSAAAAVRVAAVVEGAPPACVMFLPRYPSAAGKPPTPSTHRLVIRDLSFLADSPARSRIERCSLSLAERASGGAGIKGGFFTNTCRKSDCNGVDSTTVESRNSDISTAQSFLERLAFHRHLEDDEEFEDAVAGHNSANKLFLSMRTEFLNDCPALLVRATPQARLEIVERMLQHFHRIDHRRAERRQAFLARAQFLQQHPPCKSFSTPSGLLPSFALHESVKKTLQELWWRLDGFSLADYKAFLRRALQRAREEHQRSLKKQLQATRRRSSAVKTLAKQSTSSASASHKEETSSTSDAPWLPSNASYVRGPELRGTHIARVLKSYVPRAFKKHAFFRTNMRFSDVGGLHKAKEDLQDMLTLSHEFKLLVERSGVSIHQGVLLVGPPGCGKTLLAQAVVGELGMRCICVKGPELLSKYIGSSEAAVREVFAKAQQAKPCLIFFDEIDALATKRGSDTTGVTDRVVNQLLCELDGFQERQEVYVVAASSRPDRLDPALLRPGRLEKICYCGVPATASDRLEVVQACCRRVSLADDVDLEDIALRMPLNFAPADVKAVLQAANLSAVRERLASEGLLPSIPGVRDPAADLPPTATSAESAAALSPGDSNALRAGRLPAASASPSVEGLSGAVKNVKTHSPSLAPSREGPQHSRNTLRRQRTEQKQHVQIRQRHLLAALYATKPSISVQEIRHYHRRFTPFLSPAYLEDIETLEKHISSGTGTLEERGSRFAQQLGHCESANEDEGAAGLGGEHTQADSPTSDIGAPLRPAGVSQRDEVRVRNDNQKHATASSTNSSSGHGLKRVSGMSSSNSCSFSSEALAPCLSSNAQNVAIHRMGEGAEGQNPAVSSSENSGAMEDLTHSQKTPEKPCSVRQGDKVLLAPGQQPVMKQPTKDRDDCREESIRHSASRADSSSFHGSETHNGSRDSVGRTGSSRSSSLGSITSSSSAKSSSSGRRSRSSSSGRRRRRSSSSSGRTVRTGGGSRNSGDRLEPSVVSCRLSESKGRSSKHRGSFSTIDQESARNRTRVNDDVRLRTEETCQQTDERKKKKEKKRKRRRPVVHVALA